MILIFILTLLVFLGDSLRKHLRDTKLGWKIKRPSHDRFQYFEKVDGEWKHIDMERVYSAGSFYTKLCIMQTTHKLKV